MTGRPAAIYTRISEDREGTELGITRQEQDCRTLAERLGYEVVQVFPEDDTGASTRSRKPRPKYDAMLAAARAGRFHAIIAYSNSRLTRRPREVEDLIDLYERHGVRLHTVVSGDDDLSTADGRMVARIKGSVDAAEAERTGERVTRAHLQRAQMGKHNGPRPFGWQWAPGDGARMPLNEEEAAVVRECARRIIAGDGLWRIRNDLNARGITTSTGKPWQTQTLRRMLLRPRNAGTRTYKGKAISEGQWTPIYDRETHDHVVAVLTDPSRRKNNRGTEARYLLTGIAICGVCRRPMVGTAAFDYEVKVERADGPRTHLRSYPHSYKCPHAGCAKITVRMEELDRFVGAVVAGVLERDGVRLLGGNPQGERDARERIAALEAKLAIAADQYASDVITDDQLARISARIRPQIEEERSRLSRAAPAGEMGRFAGVSGAQAWLAETDIEVRKAVMRTIGVVPVVHPVGPGNGHLPVASRVTFQPQ